MEAYDLIYLRLCQKVFGRKNEEMSKTAVRNSSIELLRIITMLGVVILHYNNASIGGGFKYVTEGSINQYYLYGAESLFICAVDLFIMISAWFLCTTKERKFIKVVELIIQVIVFNYAFYFANVILGNEPISIKALVTRLLPCNYFVILYSVLYIISPYINKLLESLDKKQFKRLIVLVMLTFSVWSIGVDFLENVKGESLNGLSSISMYGSQYGYSIVNFILVYLVGAYIKINGINIRKKRLIVSISAILLVIYISSLVEHTMKLEKVTSWNYNNPLIIILSALIVLLFISVNFNNKIINELARGAFTCFLFHEAFMSKLHIESIVNRPIYILVAHQIIVALVLYLVSYLVYKLYTLCSRWFIKLITPLCNKVDISIK